MINIKSLSKLRQPLHISFISSHIFKKNMEETKKMIEELMENDLVEECSYAKEYYVLKNQTKK